MTRKLLLISATIALLLTPTLASAQEAGDAPARKMISQEEAAANADEEDESADSVLDEAMGDDEEDAAQEETPDAATEGTVTEASKSPSGQPIYESGGIAEFGLVVGLKVGGGFSQVFSPLGTSFVGELELGYTLPLPDPVNRDLQLFTSFSYAGPSVDEKVTAADPRLPGNGTWEYELTLQQLIITPGVLYRLPLSVDWVRPYAAAGMRIYLTRTEITGKAAGQDYGANEETATDYGGYGALGADFFPGGPGSILFEVQMGYSSMDGTILRNTNTGALNVAVGYRLFI